LNLVVKLFWVHSNLTSGAYDFFYNIVTHLDALGSTHLSTQDFLHEKFHTSRGKFDNDIAAMIASSFGREIPILFGKVDSISPPNSSIHPLPQLKNYANFSSPDSQTGIKERFYDNMANTTISIKDNITSRLSTLPIASLLANTFLIHSI